MVIEFALHVLPALRSSVEVDADLVREHFVDYSGGWVLHGSAHMGVKLDLGIDLRRRKLTSRDYITLAPAPQRLDTELNKGTSGELFFVDDCPAIFYTG